ncbi:MAG: hypothetical protein MZU95_02905 [Desulfomicrobium escambiense]|nr:hypothetical protein [Desulfomicrobium escambiense]
MHRRGPSRTLSVQLVHSRQHTDGQTRRFKEDVEKARHAPPMHTVSSSSFQRGTTRLPGRGGALPRAVRGSGIALARVFLRNPRIVLLDEATSALDKESENQVKAAVMDLLRDRTCLIIAHRESTVNEVDRVITIRHPEECTERASRSSFCSFCPRTARGPRTPLATPSL